MNRASQLEDEPKKARDPALFVGEKIEHGVAWLVAGAVLHSKENGLNGDIAAILKEVEEGQRRMAQLGEDVLMEVAEGFFISDFAMAFVGLGELIAELASEPRENRRADPAKRHEDIVRLIASLIDTREDIQAGRRPSPA